MTDRCKQPGKKKKYIHVQKNCRISLLASLWYSQTGTLPGKLHKVRGRVDAESTIELECPMEDDGWEEDEFQT